MDKLSEKQMEKLNETANEILERLDKENIKLERNKLDEILNKISVALQEGEDQGDQEYKLKGVKVKIIVNLMNTSRSPKHPKKAVPRELVQPQETLNQPMEQQTKELVPLEFVTP